ncbi:MAG: riboflavin kinase, partial [Bacteroidales bacterium]|nr:riboflavin kinase [Bacteroidales bacterium]
QEGFEILSDTPVLLDGIEVSSTKIRSYLAEGDIALANRMLGIPYSVTGQVEHGRNVGSTLGFPTANIVVEDPRKALPKEGVYAVEATAEGLEVRGMANLGPQPTFGEPQPKFEVNLFNFEGNLYGCTLTVRFLRRLRDIATFDSPEALARQLAQDKENALKS